MKIYLKVFFIAFSIALISCQNNKTEISQDLKIQSNVIEFAQGFELQHYNGYSILKLKDPSPDVSEVSNYILYKKGITFPDSLSKYKSIQVPVNKIVVTSTTHISSLEMLGVESSLVGFPNTDYISSEKVRKLIDSGNVTNVGENELLNTEKLLHLAPDVIVSFTMYDASKSFNFLEEAGLKVILNGDWNELSPLGKAEWIKFFGALYDKNELANSLFNNVKDEYIKIKDIAKNQKDIPSILSGSIYENVWYMPKGDSWASVFINEANGNYLWKDSKGTGSLSLSLEDVLIKGKQADIWLNSEVINSLDELIKKNPHYSQFKAVKDKKVYSLTSKKGPTGGVIFYEVASNRPDIVLKDLVKIFHPDLFPEYELSIIEHLK